MNDQPLVWVILAPLEARRLEQEAGDFRRERLGRGDKYLPKWEVSPGTGAHSALLNRNPGTRDTHESPLASRLAEMLGQAVYVLYPDEKDVLVYEPGAPARELPDDPYDMARALGTPIAGEPKKRIERSRVKGVAVVENTSAVDAARALGFKDPPNQKSGLIQITDGPSGAVVSGSDYVDVSLAAQHISERLPTRPVYTLVTGPTPDRFIARLIRGGDEVGSFEVNSGAMGISTSRLDAIKGKQTPTEIADVLGVPLDLLDLN